MATLSTDSQGDTYSAAIMSCQSDPAVLTGKYHLSDGVTLTAITRTYTPMKQLEQAAHSVLKTLQATDSDGNQWTLVMAQLQFSSTVLGLTKEASERLDNDKECLGGVNFRFEWELLA
ncbi:hypothetical protein CNMCM5623_003195 [Aspergillus felis]|uniref:Uncharacterized protein n=1 Tax=Aspergillus felis TaxID=1287682 RepID=A0A8H6PI63_9EURO|nr:hypothetical protein CNMCM5623_003195 [Aspergillus felis]